jgi:hypothetical protein
VRHAMTRVLLGVGACVSLIALWSGPAAASSPDDYHPVHGEGVTVTPALEEGGASIGVQVRAPGALSVSSGFGGGGGVSLTCVLRDLVVATGASPTSIGALTPNPEVGRPYFVQCRDPSGAIVSTVIDEFDPADLAPGVAAALPIALDALNNLRLPAPEIVTSPPADGEQIVGVKTWFWLDRWQSESAAAQSANVRATVVATPYVVVWNPGDGESNVTCWNQGKAWDPNWPTAKTDCGHVYIHRSTLKSPGATFSLSATISYRVTWSATNGESGTFDQPISTTGTVPLLVHEIQAVIGPGPDRKSSN